MQEKLSNVDSEKERWNYKPSGKVELNPMSVSYTHLTLPTTPYV